MTQTPATATIATRVSADVKQRFAAAAAQRGQTESALLAAMVERVLGQRPPVQRDAGAGAGEGDVGLGADGMGRADRISLRLPSGDGALVAERAARRGMTSATYLAMLTHRHVLDCPVMPPAEIEQLRVLVGTLGAIHRRLVNDAEVGAYAPALLEQLSQQLHMTRDAVRTVVLANQQSWEAGHA